MAVVSSSNSSDSVKALAQITESDATICKPGDINLGQPDGCYLMSGRLNVKVSAPKILNLTLSAPHMELVQIKAVFLQPEGVADNFVLILPPFSSDDPDIELLGSWKMLAKHNQFSVEMSGLNDLQNSVIDVKIPKYVFNGKLLANGTIQGSFKLVAKIPKVASMFISIPTFKGEPTTNEVAIIAQQNPLTDKSSFD